MRSRIAILLMIFAGLAGMALPAHAQTPEAGVVHAVFFYSPTCSHCQAVMARDMPPLEQKYGDKLQILYVNVSTADGNTIWASAVKQMNVPADRRGVPMLIVGDAVMVGEDEIPAEFPVLLEALIAQGGIGWPAIPGFDTAAGSLTSPEASATPSWSLTLPADPLSAWLLLPTLIGMVMLVGYVAITWSSRAAEPPAWHAWAILALILFGLCVAGYLAYVEVTASTAFCPAGDCNKVQTSEYARLFGVLPIGWIGVGGCVALLLTWLGTRFPLPRVRDLSAVAMLAGAAFGVLFSIYLTYLETFVIGAMCIWCLSSALIMTTILWLSLAPGKRALVSLGWRREYKSNAGRKRRRSRRSIARQRSGTGT
jgi:uncharacterized membrane protein